jgi:hypothetical protein
MKNIYLLSTLLIVCYNLAGQPPQKQQNIFLNHRNYVYLIFDRNISDVKFDCESDDLLLEQLTATSFGLRFSSRYTAPPEGIGGMVVLERSIFHPLWLYYKEQLPATTINISTLFDASATTDTGYIPSSTDTGLQQHCAGLLKRKRNILLVGEKAGQFEIQLHSVGVTAHHLYFVFFVNNNSKVDYTIDYHGLHIVNKTAAGGAEDILQQQYAYNEPVTIAAGSYQRYVLVYDLFTLKSKQEMIYIVKEQNGGRSLQLNIKSRYLYATVYPL